MKDILPKESSIGRLQFVKPKNVKDRLPVCILLAATGDHGFSRRFRTAAPLATLGIGSIIIENPYYGKRKPAHQFRSFLADVSDLLCMGGALVGETNGLINWMKSEPSKYGPFVLSGCSMGGLMSCYSASSSIHPIGAVPCVSPISAEPLFARGIFGGRAVCDIKALNAETPEGLKELETLLWRTDLRTWGKPLVPEACIWVNGEHDAYIPAKTAQEMLTHWDKSTMRWIPTGHVIGQLLYRSHFLQAIQDAVEVLKKKGI